MVYYFIISRFSYINRLTIKRKGDNMKATYLRLKNFVAIDATLHTKNLEIDFTKMNHSILLFIGTNGSCKTYILSQIHPFAYMGNVDVRHGIDMIIDGKDGEKEIHFVADDGTKYVIRHFYMYRKSGRTIRSYKKRTSPGKSRGRSKLYRETPRTKAGNRSKSILQSV